MEKITVKCPSCGNRMEIDPKVIAFRCAACGTKIDLDDEPVKSDLKEDSRGWQEFSQWNVAKTTRRVNDTITHIADKIAEDRERERQRQIYQEEQRRLELERQQEYERQHPGQTFLKKYGMIIFIFVALIGLGVLEVFFPTILETLNK